VEVTSEIEHKGSLILKLIQAICLIPNIYNKYQRKNDKLIILIIFLIFIGIFSFVHILITLIHNYFFNNKYFFFF